MSDIVYQPVIYIPESAYQSIRDSKGDPIDTITKQTAFTIDGDYSPFMGLKPKHESPLRMYCVVFNNLHDCPVEGVTLFAKHMDAISYPVVNDDNGNATRPPSSTKSLSGGAATDWIDPAPNKNFASVGVWGDEIPWISFYGLYLGLTVQMLERDTVLQLGVLMGKLWEYYNFNAELTNLSQKRKTDDEFYDWCDDHPMHQCNLDSNSKPDAIDIHNDKVRVRVRSGRANWSINLYVFIEDAT